MTKEEFITIFNPVYRKAVTTSEYSMDAAKKIGYGMNLKAKEVPKIMAAKVKYYCGGCCFHHAWRLVFDLRRAGIDASWATVPEGTVEDPTAEKCVVVYKDPMGFRYVADPIEDIKVGLRDEEFLEDSCKWISDKKIVDHSKIDLTEMAKEGYLHIYPEPNEKITFKEYLQNAKYENVTVLK